MDDQTKRLADQLERLRHMLLALEAYMASARDVVAHTEAMLAAAQADRPLPPPKGPKRSARRK